MLLFQKIGCHTPARVGALPTVLVAKLPGSQFLFHQELRKANQPCIEKHCIAHFLADNSCMIEFYPEPNPA